MAARLGRIRLVDPLERYPTANCLLGDIASKLPMWPLADLLVTHLPQTHPGLNVTHIAYHDPTHALCRAEVDGELGGLVQEVPLLTIDLRAHLGFGLHKSFASARALLAAVQLSVVQLFADARMALVAPLLEGAEEATREDHGMVSGRGDSGDVYLAQIDTGHFAGLPWWWRRLPGVEGEGQLVVVCPPQQLHLAHVGASILGRQWKIQIRPACTARWP